MSDIHQYLTERSVIRPAYEKYLHEIFQTDNLHSIKDFFTADVYNDGTIDVIIGRIRTNSSGLMFSTEDEYNDLHRFLSYKDESGKYFITTIDADQFQEMYDEDPKLFSLSLLCDCAPIIEAMRYIGNLNTFFIELKNIKNSFNFKIED